MVADVLGTEQPGRRSSARRRRWQAAGLALVVAAGAVVLASRSEPEPRIRTAPPVVTPSPLPPRWIPGDEVVAVGGTVRWAYALVASCRPEGCRHRLMRRDPGGGWTELRGLPTRPDADGLSTVDLVTAGEDTVAVVDRQQAYAWVSADGGTRFRRVDVRPGPALPAVPDELTADLGRCAGCQGQVGVLDPATGRRGRLATQPPLEQPPTTFADAGGTMWAASATTGRITVARSEDRGRTWRTSGVPQTTPLRGDLHLAISGAVAFLVAESLDRRFPARVWIFLGDSLTWRAVASDPGLRGEVTGAVLGADKLVVAAGDALFAEREGSIRGLPRPAGAYAGIDGLATGGGVVLADVRDAVLVADDPTEGWRLERLPS